MSIRCIEPHPAVGLPSVCLTLEGADLTPGEVRAVAARGRPVEVSGDPAVKARMEASLSLVREAVEDGWRVYGLTTGFGGMSEVSIPPRDAAASQANLLSFLSCGTGRPLAPVHVRAAMLLRANMLLRGVSGVRPEIVERLATFLNAGATPVVGDLGSIGASGDLVPLARIARAVTGIGPACRVSFHGREMDSGEVLRELGLAPLELLPKEGLAMVNGTSFSSAIAVNCLHSSKTFLALSLAAHAMMIRALLGHEDPFHPFVHECKPHPGQRWAAAAMRGLLGIDESTKPANASAGPHLQDRYSLRCLPQYFGPIVEALLRTERTVAVEMNSVTDNPLVEAESRCFVQSGNFLGQYVGLAMDELRRCLGLMAKHLDVQIALLVSPEFSHGLPASLVGTSESPLNMGLKGLQIVGNSIMPMLVHLGNPLVDHYPTHAEQFNQNINGLSWGSANLATRSVELFESYAATALIFAVQAVDLRARASCAGCDGRVLLSRELLPLYEAVYQTVGRTPGDGSPLVGGDGDQSLESYLAELTESIRGEGAIPGAVAPLVESLEQSGATA